MKYVTIHFLTSLRPGSLTVLFSLKKGVPEPTTQDHKDVVDSEILEEKPKIIISFINNLTGKFHNMMHR